MSNIVLKFPVYEMETGNFTVSILFGIIPEFRFTQQISESFHFQNGNSFFGKMETLFEIPPIVP